MGEEAKTHTEQLRLKGDSAMEAARWRQREGGFS